MYKPLSRRPWQNPQERKVVVTEISILTMIDNSSFNCNFLSLNVKGIRDKLKRESIFTWLKDKKTDIIFLQETYSTKEIEDEWRLSWDGDVCFSHGTNHSRGVMVLIDSKLDVQILNTIIDNEGRYIIIECNIQGLNFTIANVYFPVRGKIAEQIKFLQDFDKVLKELNVKDKSFIIGGDFNMIRNSDLDYIGRNKRQVQSSFGTHFEQFMDNLNLIDIWREENGLKKQFTYRQVNPFMRSRLDYWFISNKLKEIVLKCNIIPSIAPDHSAVLLQLYNRPVTVSNAKRSYWKFNNSLCSDLVYVQQMKEEIVNLKRKYQTEIEDKRVLWDFLKMKIANFTRKYSKEKAKERKQNIED